MGYEGLACCVGAAYARSGCGGGWRAVCVGAANAGVLCGGGVRALWVLGWVGVAWPGPRGYPVHTGCVGVVCCVGVAWWVRV